MLSLVPEDELKQSLLAFRNTKDTDIQNFLNFNSITYEKRHWCSVYVIVNSERLHSGELWIEGYFTLSHKVVEINYPISNTLRKRIHGGIDKKENVVHMILIGQLGKYIDENNGIESNLSGHQLLDYAFEVIEEAHERITSRCVMLECKKSQEAKTVEEAEGREKLQQIYADYGFTIFDDSEELTKFLKIIS